MADINIGGKTPENEFPFLTDKVELPSEGKFYPNLKELTIKLPTAMEEDILYDPELIRSGRVLDSLLQAICVDKTIDTEKMLVGDRNSILIRTRILGDGPMYKHDKVRCQNPDCENTFEPDVDLSTLKIRQVEVQPDDNLEFDYVLPTMQIPIKFRLMTGEDENYISKLIQSNDKKVKGGFVQPKKGIITERYLRQITEIKGRRNDKLYVRNLVEAMPKRDSASFREYQKLLTPGVDLTYQFACPHCSHTFESELVLNPVKMFYGGVS